MEDFETPNESDAEFAGLIEEVRSGSQDAAWQLIECYGPQILRVVRRRLPVILRQKFDSQDFVQAAWASVFAHRSRLTRFSRPDEFVAFMAAVAGNKVGMEVRKRLHGKKYNVQNEKSLNDSAKQPGEVEHAQQPSPSQVAVARERWSLIMADQPSHYRKIVEMRYSGISYREIAERLGFDESTVRRAMKKIWREQAS